MNLKKMKLGTKLIAFCLLLGLTPLVIVGLISVNKAKDALSNEAQNKLTAVRDIKKSQLEQYIVTTQGQLKMLAINSAVHSLFDTLVHYHKQQKVGPDDNYPVDNPEYLRIWEQGKQLRSVQEITNVYDIFMICEKHGHVMYTNAKEADLGQNIRVGNLKNSGLGKLWKTVVETKGEAFADFMPYAPSGGEPAAFYGCPLYNDNGEIRGVLAVQFPIEEINAIMQERSGMGETGETYIVGSDYLMRSDSYLDSIHHTVKASFKNPEKGSVRTVATKEALSGKDGFEIIKDYNDNWVLSSFMPFDFLGSNWAIIAEIDKAEALAASDTLSVTITITMIFAAVLIVLAAIFISKGISKPVGGMAQMAQSIADGDLTKSITVTTEDEIGDLGIALLKMKENLSSMILNIKNTTETVASASEELNSVSGEMQKGAQGSAQQAISVSSATEQMSTNINTMASAAEEMSVNANEVASAAEQTSQNMSAVSSAVEEMSVSINQIAQNAGQAREVATKATDSSNEATKTMGILSDAAKEIGNVTEVIKRIAEQTNLLALNATIEAASAGEAGKGFAVVANEIKELANQSAQAADDIAEKIAGVQSNTENAVEVIAGVSTVIEQIGETVNSIAQSVEQQNRAVNDISANVSQANNGTQNIAASIAEVASGANEVSRNSGEASKGANQVSSDIVEIKESAEAAVLGSGQVTKSAGELAKLSGDLKEIVEQFIL